jgi:hypothetical protein
MKTNVVIYLFDTKAKADACAYSLQKTEQPPYEIVSVIETKNAFVAAYIANDYDPSTKPDWSKAARGAPSVFVVLASR